MGVLDDAIREHLELKREHGAPDDEITRKSAEALGPPRRERPQSSEAAGEPAAAPDEDGVTEGDAAAPADREQSRDSGDNELFADMPEREARSAAPAGEPESTYAPPEPADEETVVAEPSPEPSSPEPTPVEPSPEPPATAAEVDPPAPPPGPVLPELGGNGAESTAPPTAPPEPPMPELEPEPERPPEPEPELPPEPEPSHEPEPDADATQLYEAVGEPRPDAPDPAAEQPPDESADEDEGEQPPAGEDVLEDTPEFLQETPEDERLWFEQRPPRDFDFD